MEVLLAVIIVVILMGAMFGLYWRGLEVRDRTTAMLDEITAQRLLLDRISEELRTAMVYPFLRFGLTGEVGRAEWIACRLPGPGAWTPAGITDAPRTPESDIQIVGYRLRYGEDENGDPIVVGLERTVQRVLAPETAEESDGEDSAAVQVQFVTGHVKFIRFQYYDGETWSETWDASELPAAVQVVIGREPMTEDATLDEYTAPTMRRTIFVPGRRPAQDADARAMEDG
jgi:hypothetical protein